MCTRLSLLFQFSLKSNLTPQKGSRKNWLWEERCRQNHANYFPLHSAFLKILHAHVSGQSWGVVWWRRRQCCNSCVLWGKNHSARPLPSGIINPCTKNKLAARAYSLTMYSQGPFLTTNYFQEELVIQWRKLILREAQLSFLWPSWTKLLGFLGVWFGFGLGFFFFLIIFLLFFPPSVQ